MNKAFVSGLALLLLVSGVSAFYFAPSDFSTNRFQLKPLRLYSLVFNPFSVQVEEVRRVNNGAFSEVEFTINSVENERFEVSLTYRLREGNRIRRAEIQVGEFQRGENSALMPIIGRQGVIGYALKACLARRCVYSQQFAMN